MKPFILFRKKLPDVRVTEK